VVCALQVLEHSAEPLALARAAVRALKPGGLFVAAVPSWPSPIVEIPNLPANAPPHHLSWWTTGALETLCQELGLEAIQARGLPAQRQHRLLHWAGWFSPIKARGPYFKRAWPWHLSLGFGFGLARLVSPLGILPPHARSADVFVCARKPAVL
jgi:SAM-dependent methyltransferase